MDKCSTEIISHIVDFACLGPDGGQVARQLRLVSRYIQDVAAVFEFRALAIVGLRMLEGALARLEKANEDVCARGGGNLGIHYLFLSDYASKHARALGTTRPEGCRYEHSQEGSAVIEKYFAEKERFWEPAARVLALASPSLRSLTVLAFDSFEGHRCLSLPRSHNGDLRRAERGILGAMSGLHLPLLTDICVKHDLRYHEDPESFWVPLTMPALRRMSIINDWAPHVFNRNRSIHTCPLLLDMHSRYPLLESLHLRDNQFSELSRLMAVVCGHTQFDPDTLDEPCTVQHLDDGTLPGALHSVTLEFGPVPAEMFDAFSLIRFFGGPNEDFAPPDGTGMMVRRRLPSLVEAIRQHLVAGLSLVLPTKPSCEGEFDGLYENWRNSQCSAI
ncbi:hypothetical protein M0805_008237 [Coniferiporia weirii]|nr:hypothetical protein M0805_008237 [Coniferiporia weirii]